MTRIGVVILNYLAYEATMDTIAAFDAQDREGFEVICVVVDNCSPNGSFEVLSEKYHGRNDIILIKTERNLGFANGNNAGYKELLKHMSPDIVIVSNDDILLPQQGLYRWIADCCEKYGFAMLGPDIYAVNGGFHQSPAENYPRDPAVVRQKLNNLRKRLIKCYIKKLLRKSSYSGRPSWENKLYSDFHDDKTLHGAFQIFSSEYFRHYSEPYDPSTFLYMEEEIVNLRCEKKGLKVIYSPDYQVHHLQAVATNMVNKENYNKEYFRAKNLFRSTKEYLKVLNNSN